MAGLERKGRHAFTVAVLVWSMWLNCTAGSQETAIADGRLEEIPASLARDMARYGCGPVAVYVAVRRLGIAQSLREICEGCEWMERPRALSLQELHDLIEAVPGLSAEGVRLSPEELATTLERKDTATIIVVRKQGESEANHALVAISREDDKFTLFDYPELVTEVTTADLADMFDGHAIIVTRQRRAPPPASPIVSPTAIVVGLLLVSLIAYGRIRAASEKSQG